MTKGLTKTKIPWCTHSWAVISGCDNRLPCFDYCYARIIHKRFLMGHPHYNDDFSFKYNPDILEAPMKLKRPSIIFIGSMGELWNPHVDNSIQVEVLDMVSKCQKHTFLTLTKCPAVLRELVDEWSFKFYSPHHSRWDHGLHGPLPLNLWVGTTVSEPEDLGRLKELQLIKHTYKFISFEPLLGDVAADMDFSLSGIGWVIIGGLSRGGRKINPDSGHFMRLYLAARDAKIPVLIKENCTILSNPPREFPYGVTQLMENSP